MQHEFGDTVFPVQRTDARWLAEKGTRYLAHEMRVGKTATVIRANDLLRARRILWITTGTARLGHAKGWQAYSPVDHPCRVMLTGRDTPLDVGVTVTSYDLAAGPLYDKLRKMQFDVVNLDEAHKLKNRKAKRTIAMFGEDSDRADGVTANAQHVIPFSGTPAPNHPAELWPVLRALFPDTIMRENGTPMPYSVFENRYCKTKFNPFGGIKIVGGKNLKELRAKIDPYFLRRTFAETYPDAAGVEIEQLFVDAQGNLDELRALEHEGMIAEIKQRLERLQSEKAREALLDEIEQKLAMRLRRLTGVAKVPGVVKWVRERMADAQKVVVFGHHKEVLDGLCDGLAKYKPLRVSGGISAKAKAEAEHVFATDVNRRVFVGNLQAAGEAIDLSAADDIVLVEASWVPGDNEQVIRRIVNLAKKRENIAWFATLAGSIDEQIQATNVRKTRDLMELFGK